MAHQEPNEHCQNHPAEPVTARCVRFNRRFCDLDFAPDAAEPAECLSAGTYCEYRPQCLVWEKVRARRSLTRNDAPEIQAARSGE
jgi:hypothetical protein